MPARSGCYGIHLSVTVTHPSCITLCGCNLYEGASRWDHLQSYMRVWTRHAKLPGCHQAHPVYVKYQLSLHGDLGRQV